MGPAMEMGTSYACPTSFRELELVELVLLAGTFALPGIAPAAAAAAVAVAH